MENLQDLQKKRIEKSFSELYGLDRVTENTFEKGGEGSRGGKVIGHTKSGKPVYKDHSSDHEDYKDFSKKDHEDAGDIHHKISSKLEDKYVKSDKGRSYSQPKYTESTTKKELGEDKLNEIKNREKVHSDSAKSHWSKMK